MTLGDTRPSTAQDNEVARLKSRIRSLEHENMLQGFRITRLENDLENVRKLGAGYVHKGDCFCYSCHQDLGGYDEGYATEYRFCPYCGASIDGWEEM